MASPVALFYSHVRSSQGDRAAYRAYVVAAFVCLICAIGSLFAAELDRSVLPIPEPKVAQSIVLDARNATPPPRFQVKAPADAPNVLIILIDDMGFGQSTAFGGPIHMQLRRSVGRCVRSEISGC